MIRREDLEQYRVHERRPLQVHFRNHQILLNPPPAQSGVLIAFTLSLLDPLPTPLELEDLALALELTNRYRDSAHSGLPDLPPPLSPRKRRSYQNHFLRLRQSLPWPLDSPSPGATTHVSILDAEGNAASVTTTNGEECGHLLPSLGFMLNNMLGEEDLNPRGFHLYPPGSRLASMVAPTIALRRGKPVLVTGSAGSNRIRSVIVQILVHVLDRGRTLQEATTLPRVHLEGNILHCEPGTDESGLATLASRYQIRRWSRQSLFFGGANSAGPGQGAGDTRRRGYALLCADTPDFP